jgi:hypothetical protein
MNLFDRGRLTGISGMESVLTLHPDRMGTRIKKNVIKMLENAHITGGWKSQSRQVAEQLAVTFELTMLQDRYNGIKLYAAPAPEVRDELIDLIKADIAMFLLEHPDYHRQWYSERARDAIELLQSGKSGTIDFRTQPIVKQAVALINKSLPDKARDANQRVIDLLLSNKPIYITTIRS